MTRYRNHRHRPPWWSPRRWVRPVLTSPRGARAQAAVAEATRAEERLHTRGGQS